MSDVVRKPMPKFDYTQPAGAPAFHDPGSVALQVYKNPIALGVGDVAAEAAGRRASQYQWPTYKRTYPQVPTPYR
jgi:hypothetical protein